MKNKKRVIIAIVIATLIVLCIILTRTSMYKIKKANNIYGEEYCTKDENSLSLFEDKEHSTLGGDALTPYKCEICGKIQVNGNTAVPKICEKCAMITNRCQECGKLKR